MKSFDIVGIGWPCVDYAMQVESLPKADRGARVRGTSWQGGGVVPTGLVAASRLGLRCALIGCVGDFQAVQSAGTATFVISTPANRPAVLLSGSP